MSFSARPAHENAAQARPTLAPSVSSRCAAALRMVSPAPARRLSPPPPPLPPLPLAHCPSRGCAHSTNTHTLVAGVKGRSAVSIVAGAALSRLPALGSRRTPPRRGARTKAVSGLAVSGLAASRARVSSESAAAESMCRAEDACAGPRTHVQGRTRPGGRVFVIVCEIQWSTVV